VVIDSSAILAIYFDEPSASWVLEHLARAERIEMSTVNLGEVLMRIRDRDPMRADAFEGRLLAERIEFVPPDVEQTVIAARARLQFPLNFGDCFAYALAKARNLPLLTLDQDFRSTDLSLVLPGA